jgi:hypothetical protein
MRRLSYESDENVLDPSIEDQEPDEESIKNYTPLPKSTEFPPEVYPAKKSDRNYGGPLTYPKGTKIIINTKDFRFWSKGAIMDFISTLTATKPKEIVTQVQEKFEKCPIGVARGVEGHEVNVIWVEPNIRVYYDPETGEEIKFMPKCIKT